MNPLVRRRLGHFHRSEEAINPIGRDPRDLGIAIEAL